MKNLKMPENNFESDKDKKEKESRMQQLLKGRGCNVWSSLLWLIIAMAFLFWNFGDLGAFENATMISYSEFRKQVQDDNVTSVTVQGESIRGQFEKAIDQTEGDQTTSVKEFKTILPSFGDNGLLTLLEAHDVTVETQPEQNFSWINLLFSILPFLLLAVCRRAI